MSTITITPSKAPVLLQDALRAGLVPMLVSSPGLGKSTIARKIASDKNLKVIDLRLSQCDPTDLGGFPMINNERTKASYVPMNTFPIEGDEIPLNEKGKHYNGWLLLMDEFNSAPPSVQAAAYKIVLDKEVGLHKLHKDVHIICAGNLATDRAIVNRMSTAMQSRLIHFEMEPDLSDWMAWAGKENIDHRIMSFVAFRPELLHYFSPDHADKTFPCPRTWEFLSRIVSPWSDIPADKMAIVAGTIGEGTAMEFTSFCQIYGRIPTIENILAAPKTVQWDAEPSIMYAMSGLIAKHITETNVDTLMQAMERLPLEFQIYSLKGAIIRNSALTTTPSVDAWISRNAKDLM